MGNEEMIEFLNQIEQMIIKSGASRDFKIDVDQWGKLSCKERMLMIAHFKRLGTKLTSNAP